MRYLFRVYGYVVMPDHVHILVSKPSRGTVANAIQSLKISSSMRSAQNRTLNGMRSPLWQKRYYDRNVSSHEEFLEYLRYIHRNPVKKGLCREPGDWSWSSFQHYATGERGPVEIESEWTARLGERSN